MENNNYYIVPGSTLDQIGNTIRSCLHEEKQTQTLQLHQVDFSMQLLENTLHIRSYINWWPSTLKIAAGDRVDFRGWNHSHEVGLITSRIVKYAAFSKDDSENGILDIVLDSPVPEVSNEWLETNTNYSGWDCIEIHCNIGYSLEELPTKIVQASNARPEISEPSGDLYTTGGYSDASEMLYVGPLTPYYDKATEQYYWEGEVYSFPHIKDPTVISDMSYFYKVTAIYGSNGEINADACIIEEPKLLPNQTRAQKVLIAPNDWFNEGYYSLSANLLEFQVELISI